MVYHLGVRQVLTSMSSINQKLLTKKNRLECPWKYKELRKLEIAQCSDYLILNKNQKMLQMKNLNALY